jgi:hypothetical protein
VGNDESEDKRLGAQRDWCLVVYGEHYVAADGPVVDCRRSLVFVAEGSGRYAGISFTSQVTFTVVQPKEMYELIYPRVSLGWYQIYLSAVHAIKLDTNQRVVNHLIEMLPFVIDIYKWTLDFGKYSLCARRRGGPARVAVTATISPAKPEVALTATSTSTTIPAPTNAAPTAIYETTTTPEWLDRAADA